MAERRQLEEAYKADKRAQNEAHAEQIQRLKAEVGFVRLFGTHRAEP